MWALVETAERADRKVIICHVLRFAPFYRAVREQVLAGTIGEILNVQTVEHVSYHHMAVGFVRGKWANTAYCHSSMLMAKCCHDLDLIAWMKSGVQPRAVSSFGSNFQFRPEKAPPGAGTRCLVDCQIEADCLYSARKHYIDHPDRWSFYVWDSLEHIDSPTIEDKTASLKTDNPYGRCVWRCDMDVVDHQSVVVEFEDGCTATHNMVGGTARPSRSIHLMGTLGEIQGVFEDQRFVIRHIDTAPGPRILGGRGRSDRGRRYARRLWRARRRRPGPRRRLRQGGPRRGALHLHHQPGRFRRRTPDRLLPPTARWPSGGWSSWRLDARCRERRRSLPDGRDWAQGTGWLRLVWCLPRA